MTPRNRVREAIEADEAAVGARCMTRSPMFVEVYGDLGFDFAWVDFEHGGASPWDATVFETLVRAARGADTDLLVRLPSGDPHLVRKVLDTGVRTLLIPRVETAAEVRRAVEASRFRYDGGPGERGAASGLASGWGGADGYVEGEDGTVLVGVMIENRAAVENIEEILGVPDLGFAFVGPADLSTSYGHPLETDHPDVLDAIGRVRDACLDAGVPVGRIANDAAAASEAIDDGYRVLRVGSEVASARTVLGERLSGIRDAE